MAMAMSEAREAKVKSLKIDPQAKLPRRSSGFLLVVLLILGLLLGAGVMYALMGSRPPSDGATAAAAPSGAATPAPAGASAQSPAPAPSAAPGDVILSASGYVTPRIRVSLSPQVTGIVTWVGIEKGDRVTKGQELVRLDDDRYQAELREREARLKIAEARLAELENGTRPSEIARAKAQVAEAEADLMNAERNFERSRVLVTVNSVESRKALEDAEAMKLMANARLGAIRETLALLEEGPRREQVEAARAEVEAARASVESARIAVLDTLITATQDGTILEKLVEVGELVTPQSFGGSRGARTELLSLANLSDLQVEVDINENDFAKVSRNQDTFVILDAYPTRKYRGRVREIAPEADRTKATVQIKVQILDPDELVLPEMSARVDLLQGPTGG